MQPIIRQSRDTGECELVQMRWGLIPYGIKPEAFKRLSTVSAKAENVTTGIRARPVSKHSCLVPASGFYEWKKVTPAEPVSLQPSLIDVSVELGPAIEAPHVERLRVRKPGVKATVEKVPFAFDLTNGGMMAFAGLWDAWKDPANGQWLQSYTIITTEANELMAPVRDRMPVILHPSDFNRVARREPTDSRRATCCARSPPTRWKPLRSPRMSAT
jgi:putative SOS response-associated peptidase YedK